MPCCKEVLDTVAIAIAVAASPSDTLSWLRRLHTKAGLSVPAHLRIDDVVNGARAKPPLPLPHPFSTKHRTSSLVIQPSPPKKSAKPKRQHPKPMRSSPRLNPNPRSEIPQHHQPPMQLITMPSNVSVIPSSLQPTSSPFNPFRKQSRTLQRIDGQPIPTPPPCPNKYERKKKLVPKKRQWVERTKVADQKICTKTYVTVIDTSIDSWNATKLLIRKGDVWKVQDKKPSVVSAQEDNGNRKASLVSKLKREKDKENKNESTTSQGIVDASSGDVIEDLDQPIRTLKRPKCLEPKAEDNGATITQLQNTMRSKKNGLANIAMA